MTVQIYIEMLFLALCFYLFCSHITLDRSLLCISENNLSNNDELLTYLLKHVTLGHDDLEKMTSQDSLGLWDSISKSIKIKLDRRKKLHSRYIILATIFTLALPFVFSLESIPISENNAPILIYLIVSIAWLSAGAFSRHVRITKLLLRMTDRASDDYLNQFFERHGQDGMVSLAKRLRGDFDSCTLLDLYVVASLERAKKSRTEGAKGRTELKRAIEEIDCNSQERTVNA